MHWVTIDGLRVPKRVGGHPALDFCNTRAGWGEPFHPRQEWLGDYDHLVVWAGYAGLISDTACRRLRGEAPAAGERVLAEARQLRAALYEVLLGRGDRAAFATVAAHAERAAAAAVLTPAEGGEPAGTALARWRLPEADLGPDLPLLAAAHAAAALLTAPDRPAVGVCPGKECGWLFLNPRGRRRWCSMASCGNRAKVRAHARRHR